MNPTNPINATNLINSISVECIGVIGLGYVGLSLASTFGRITPTIVFEVDQICARGRKEIPLIRRGRGIRMLNSSSTRALLCH